MDSETRMAIGSLPVLPVQLRQSAAGEVKTGGWDASRSIEKEMAHVSFF
jgi:hypothetical protein